MYNLRRLVGLKLGGEISSIPTLFSPATSRLHSRALGSPGNYSINFQDPAGSPTGNLVDSKNRPVMKIGWSDFSSTLGYGWFGDASQRKYSYLSGAPSSVSELQKSVIYDDYGRKQTFQIQIPNGGYNVTVSVGWYGKSYTANCITVQGVPVITKESNAGSYLVRTVSVFVSSNVLSLEMGCTDYTMLNSMIIEFNGQTEPSTPYIPLPSKSTKTSGSSINVKATSSSLPLILICALIMMVVNTA